MKIILDDCNAKVLREKTYKLSVGKYRKYKETNDNGQRARMRYYYTWAIRRA